MSVNTILIDISVDDSQVKNEAQISTMVNTIHNILKGHFDDLKLMITEQLNDCLLKLYACNQNGTINLKIYDDGLITLTIDHKGDGHDWMSTFKVLETEIREQISNLKQCLAFCPIKRGNYIRYLFTTDDRLVEYDIEKIVLEERSPYQKIQIFQSKTMGNILVLDGLQSNTIRLVLPINKIRILIPAKMFDKFQSDAIIKANKEADIAEADLIYTETLMGRGIEDYSNKEVLILGGGDGALLYELLKENPKEVTMVEIDEMVMRACSEHMSSICGNVLRERNGPNYKIIVNDCLKQLNKFVKDGQKFDYIFSDLTDVPITESPNGETWDFINKKLTACFKIMKPNSKFMTHLTASVMEDAVRMYENQLKTLNPNIIFTTSKAFIPSFYEVWVFGQVCLK